MGASCSASFSENIKHLQATSNVEEEPAANHRLAKRIFEACRLGEIEETRRCLAEGVSANIRDEHGWMPLHYSASRGDLEVCRLLLECQGDANVALPDLSTPLMLAVEEAHLKVATLLLESGALTKVKDEDGFTAMGRCDANIKEEFRRLTSSASSERAG
mmetsp:Transcript_104065/g.291577  ORF Transcript_104065/g.291577 Transcript_104065/m.291577 type:complete len:160 (-) Transcript_104065:99-578(-)